MLSNNEKLFDSTTTQGFFTTNQKEKKSKSAFEKYIFCTSSFYILKVFQLFKQNYLQSILTIAKFQ